MCFTPIQYRQQKTGLLPISLRRLLGKIPAILLAYLMNCSIALADTEQKYQKSISRISKEITQLSRNLNANKSSLKDEQHALYESEKTLSTINKTLEATNKQLLEKQELIKALDTEQTSLAMKQAKSRTALSKLLESKFKNGDSSHLKLVLNQENPYAVGRLNNYQQYFLTAIKSRFSEVEEQLKQSKKLQREYRGALAQLQTVQQEQEFLKGRQHSEQATRKAAVEKLNAKVVASKAKLEKLKNDRDRLSLLLKNLAIQAAELERIEKEKQEIERRAAEFTEQPTKSIPAQRQPVKGGFLKQKGRLNCPVSSKAKTMYGERIPSSGMRSEGIFYETRMDTDVTAVFRGRVLFADILKGFGLLLIIDHGDDHISLYGHNKVIYKKVGDSVVSNEVVSKTGVTGGLKSAGLYFEIRNKTTPVNPSAWCK